MNLKETLNQIKKELQPNDIWLGSTKFHVQPREHREKEFKGIPFINSSGELKVTLKYIKRVSSEYPDEITVTPSNIVDATGSTYKILCDFDKYLVSITVKKKYF